MKDIDKYAYISKLRLINPSQKLLFMSMTLIVCLCADSVAVSIAVTILMTYLIVYKGGTSIKLFLKLLSFPLGFLVLSILTLLFEISADTDIFLYFISIGGFNVGITSASLEIVKILFLKSFACVSCLYFLCLTTPIPDFLEALRKIKCPVILIEMMELIYRFIFILIDTAYIMQVAQASRLGYKNIKVGMRSFGMLISNLLVRALKINNNLYIALESRGYNGTLKVLNNQTYTDISSIKMILIEIVLIAIAVGEKIWF